MYKLYLAILIMLLFCFSTKSYGFVESPPPDKDASISNWREDIQQNVNMISIPVITTNPNGNRKGKEGNLVWYYSTTGMYLMGYASAPTVWRGVQMKNIIE